MRKREYKRQETEVRLKVQKSALKGMRNARGMKKYAYKNVYEKNSPQRNFPLKIEYTCVILAVAF
jgi:hypothetical protein